MDSRATKRMVLLATLGALGWTGAAHAGKFECGRTGGDITYGLEANVARLDMQANSAASTRDIAMNTYETLVTRDENMKPLLQLAQSVEASEDARCTRSSFARACTSTTASRSPRPMRAPHSSAMPASASTARS